MVGLSSPQKRVGDQMALDGSQGGMEERAEEAYSITIVTFILCVK